MSRSGLPRIEAEEILNILRSTLHFARGRWPLLAATGLFALALAAILLSALGRTDGSLIYPLDDTYIHMAIARNFAQHGVWGISNTNFSSSTSSPLWTFLLSAAFFVLGVKDWIPLALTVLIGFALIGLAYRFLRANIQKAGVQTILLCLSIAIAPLPALAFLGMEHVLHMFLMFLFIVLASEMLARGATSKNERLLLLFVAALLCVARYEGLFVVGVAAICFFIRGRRTYAAVLLGTALLPVTLYGLFSISQGWFFLPNSVALKGGMTDFSTMEGLRHSVGGRIFSELRTSPHLLILLVGSFLALSVQLYREGIGARGWMLILFLGALIAHLQFSRTGQLARYEAYLVFTGSILLLVELAEALLKWFSGSSKRNLGSLAALLAGLGVCAAPLILTGGEALRQSALGSQNIYQQQYQTAKFLRAFGDLPVVANDIGAVSYFSNVRIVDTQGLGTLQIARMRLARLYNTDSLGVVARKEGAKLAVVFDLWIYRDGGVPAGWKPLGGWTIHENVVCGESSITFYATTGDSAGNVRDALARFKPQLPRGVDTTDL